VQVGDCFSTRLRLVKADNARPRLLVVSPVMCLAKALRYVRRGYPKTRPRRLGEYSSERTPQKVTEVLVHEPSFGKREVPRLRVLLIGVLS
jgi:hypothetical protein